jgi:hypothetical protein
MELLAHELA